MPLKKHTIFAQKPILPLPFRPKKQNEQRDFSFRAQASVRFPNVFPKIDPAIHISSYPDLSS